MSGRDSFSYCPGLTAHLSRAAALVHWIPVIVLGLAALVWAGANGVL